MANRITSVAVDALDPLRLATFWCGVLGYEVLESDEDDVLIGAADAAFAIEFLRVPDGPKVVKNRLHFDVNATDRDQQAELARLVELGAVPVDIGQGDQTWQVLADPEGNEFCLLRRQVDPLPIA